MSTATTYAENEMAYSVRGFSSDDTAYGTTGGRVIELPAHAAEKEKVLPLPGWLVKLYFIFPVVLYVPDVIFNYYVYSDGVQPKGNEILQIASYALWGFLSIGVVGMAYLLSVLAPWHWGQGHRIQAFFCGLGVVIATAITTWNSLSYRSEDFVHFRTDEWAVTLWPQLHDMNISITMILVAVAPPFWGLFWAIVQPTETGRSLRQLQESHEERLLRIQQEAELKRLKAETNAKVREAQLRGMAATAAAAREQAAQLLNQKRNGENAEGEQANAITPVVADAIEDAPVNADIEQTGDQVTSSMVQPDVASATQTNSDTNGQRKGRQPRSRASATSARSNSTGTNSKSATAPVAAGDDQLAQVDLQSPVAQVARGMDIGPMGHRSLSPTARDADLSHIRQPGDDLAGLAASLQH